MRANIHPRLIHYDPRGTTTRYAYNIYLDALSPSNGRLPRIAGIGKGIDLGCLAWPLRYSCCGPCSDVGAFN